MSNKKKLQKIMAEDDRMFQAMSSKQFGRSVALRSVEQPTQKTSPKKRRVRKEARGWSQFTVSPMGVFDALSSSLTASMFPIPQSSDKVDTGKDDEQGEADESSKQTISPKASRGEEVSQTSSNINQLPTNSSATEVTSVEADNDLNDFSLSAQSTEDIGNLFESLDASRESDIPDVEMPSLTEVNSVDDAVDFNTPESREVKAIADDDFGINKSKPRLSLVQKRRNAAEKERAAAARNFAKQRQAPPIMGIPDPAPIEPIQFEGEAAGPNGDETLIAQDRAATQQLEFARSMVDITEKMAIELQAISIRLRTVELFLDRM